MPLKLNVAAQYAQVDPAFIDQMKEIWKTRWKGLNDSIKAQDPRYRKMEAKKNAPVMSRLKGLCTDKLALDKEITRLRGLPYEHFYSYEYRGSTWLVGLTRPIIMDDDLRRYQAPRYYVYIPQDITTRGTDAPFHFVPQGHEMTTARHPHHNVKTRDWNGSGDLVDIDYSVARSPLDYKPATCWGSFGTIAQSCTRSADVVDLFRNIGVYLTRINQNSLLTRPFSACFFLEDIGPSIPAEKKGKR